MFGKYFFREIHGRRRKFSSDWLDKHHWMRYSLSKDAVYCVYCVYFGSAREECKEKTFGRASPVSDWTNLSKYVNRHLAENSFHHSNVQAGKEFLRLSDKNSDVSTQLSSFHQEQMIKNRHILKENIKVILFCGRQNVVIRGHTDDRSNFVELLNMKAERDPILTEHLVGGDPRKKYLSLTIQNELIDVCGDQIRDSLATACNSAGCFGFIADEATDCATIEQIALCVRYFDRKRGEVWESFLGFKEAKETTGEALAETFILSLEAFGIEINKMRGQGYDSAANMAGKHRGVQALIQQRIPFATYTPCRAHYCACMPRVTGKEPYGYSTNDRL